MIDWKISDPRSLLQKEGVHNMGQYVDVEGYFGNTVVTNIGLASFITSFDRIMAECKTRVIDATEGGASKKGMEKMTLQKVIDDIILEGAIDKSVLNPFLSIAENSADLIKLVVPRLHKDIKIIEDVIENATKGLEIADKIVDIKDEFTRKRMLKENETYSINAHEASKKNALIGVSIYAESRRLFARENRNEKEFYKQSKKKRVQQLIDDDETLKLNVKRNQQILTAALGAGKRLKEMYEEALSILNKYVETGDEGILINKITEDVDLSDADKYFEVNNFAHPLYDAKRLLKMFPSHMQAQGIKDRAEAMRDKAIFEAQARADRERRQDLIDYFDLVKKSSERGRLDKNYNECLVMLKKANALFPEKPEAKWGLATCLFFTGEAVESKSHLIDLVMKYPDNLRYKFELGLVTLEGDIEEGLQIINSVMEKTAEFKAAKKLSVIGTTLAKYFFTRSGCSCTASLNEQKMMPFSANCFLKVVPTDTLSNTASTATPARRSRSLSGMPSFS